MSSRTTLPRQEIKRLDNTESRFPSVVRTGDSRKGNFAIKFDDTKTILFEPSNNSSTVETVISYPTTLLISSSFRNVLTSSITVTGNSKKAAVGEVNGVVQISEQWQPFKESTFPELSLTNLSFYKTGSNVDILSGEFDYSIASKTAIRMEYPISENTEFRIQSASIYYYDTVSKKFTEIAPEKVTPPYVPAVTGVPRVPIHDAKLFGPFGTPQLSGSAYVRVYDHARNSTLVASASIYSALQTLNNTASVLLDDSYLASDNQVISLSDYISHPFLLEKANIRLPFSASANWFETTTFQNNSENNFPDAGGPCITFSLLCQNKISKKRKILLSGTIIPSSDNIAQRMEYASGSTTVTYLNGFLNFGTPTAVVTRGLGAISFTDEIQLNCVTSIQNSVISFNTNDSNKTWSGNNFADSFICAVDPYGRSHDSKISARGLQGKDFSFVSLDNVVDLGTKLYGSASGAGALDGYSPKIYQLVSHNEAPFILYPEDEIVLAVSKYRPILSVNGATFNSLQYTNSSHNVGITSGSLKLTLWGSLVKEGKEHHDTLNSALTTNSVHELIGAEMLLDQLDIFDREELVGTYIDDVVSGSMTTAQDTRGKWYSSANINNSADFLSYKTRFSEKFKKKYELISFSRTIQATSQERYYDSIPPAIDDILIQTSHRLHAYPLFDEKTNKICTLAHFDQWGSSISNLTWTRSYPFEPAYSTCIRKMIDKFRSRNYYFNGSVGGYFGQPLNFDNNFVIYQTVNSTTSKLVLDKDGSEVTGMKNEDALKYLYGIGDENQCYEYNTVLFGATNRPSTLVSNVSASYGHAGVLLRGWKYGLINANPQYTKTHWKRDHFGYLRDMLEQRHDSKFYFPNGLSQGGVIGQSYIDNSPVAIKFVNVSGTIVRPEETYSSNLSFEATSSLPYFDGFVRNRESPLRTIGIQNFSYLE